MTPQATLEERDVVVLGFEDIADQVIGAEYAVERPVGVMRTGQTSAWLRQAERQLHAIERLRAGWDSQGGDPPNPETVRAGAGLLKLLARVDSELAQPHIHPTPSGGVQFHWEKGPRYVEIEMLNPSTAQYYYVESDSREEIEGELRWGDDVAKVLRLLQRI